MLAQKCFQRRSVRNADVIIFLEFICGSGDSIDKGVIRFFSASGRFKQIVITPSAISILTGWSFTTPSFD